MAEISAQDVCRLPNTSNLTEFVSIPFENIVRN